MLIAETIGIALLIIFTSFIYVITGRIQSVTLWAGKKIAPMGLEDEVPQGFQDAITPKFQNKLNILTFVLFGIVFLVGFLIKWYLGFILLLLTLILQSVVELFIPRKVNKYLNLIIHDIDNRHADYLKNNDKLRAEASEEISQKLKTLYMEIRDKNMEIPDFEEIRKMPLG